MRNTDSIYIYDWMIQRLKLTAKEVLIYAIIHNIECFTGKLFEYTIQNIANTIGISHNNASKTLGSLIKRGYIKRVKYREYGRIHLGYSVSFKGIPCDVPDNYVEPDFTFPEIQKKAKLTKDRRNYKYQKWRDGVLKRDGNKCTLCGAGEFLHVHHIKPYLKYPELRLDISNGVTYCEECHIKLHKKTGEKYER